MNAAGASPVGLVTPNWKKIAERDGMALLGRFESMRWPRLRRDRAYQGWKLP